MPTAKYEGGYRITEVRIKGEGEWPHTEISYVYHKEDLSDLDEPYLSAVKAVLGDKDASQNQ